MIKKILTFPILTNFLNLIKFEHSIFALPFALSGALLVSDHGLPKVNIIFWIILAMFGARSLAMSVNRIVDKEIDFKNPRTKNRELPQEKLSKNQAVIFSLISFLILLYATLMLPKICLLLLPIAAIWFFVYPFTKRFTALSHLWLGVSLGGSVLGGWLAASGEINSFVPYALGLAVTFWVAGFDVIYALEDIEFDRKNNLHSIPVVFGIKGAIFISRIFHVFTLLFLLILGVMINGSFIYWFGVIFVCAMLYYEQSLVKENDLSKINLAFFTVNGWVSVGFLGFMIAEKLL